MNDPIIPAPQEQEVFQRVWQRVMAGRAGDREEAPDPQLPQSYQPAQPSQPPRAEGDVSLAYLDALRRAMPGSQPESDPPVSDLPIHGLDELPGEGGARLRQQTLEALELWQLYRHLARRAKGSAGRSLTLLAADQHRLARKLSAAYFLRSGVRYWPLEGLAAPAISSYWGTLRRGHQAEQQTELAYRMAGDEADDAALQELYQELAQACRGHCRQLRGLMEQGYP